ncbi:MAG TPA: hypothetical protein VF269_03610 [Rhodanobacteraceae bacterium]
MRITVDKYVPGSILLEAVTGAVAGAKSSIESTQSIQTMGGHGSVNFQDFSINDPLRIKSTTQHVEVVEFFLCREDGSEVPIKMRNANFPVRDGQKVTVVLGNFERDMRHVLASANHATGIIHENIWWHEDFFVLITRLGAWAFYGALVGWIFFGLPILSGVFAVFLALAKFSLAWLVLLVPVVAFLGFRWIAKWFVRRNTVPDAKTTARLTEIKKTVTDEVIHLLKREGIAVNAV